MTYCVALRLDRGLVFLSDSRTNAGVDQVSSFRKMVSFERPDERLLVLMTAGNLAISQAVRELVRERVDSEGRNIWTVPTMHDAVRLVGDAVREVRARDGEALAEAGIEFNVSLVLGGQIKGERCRLYMVYAAGNFIEAMDESPYFQIGESKYGKPVIDRMVTTSSTLEEGAKCVLVSMDSTLRSNISVGLPLDLLCYEADSLRVTRFTVIDHNNAYFRMIHDTWGQRLKQIFSEIPDPVWTEGPDMGLSDATAQPVRAYAPGSTAEPAAHQILAEASGRGSQSS